MRFVNKILLGMFIFNSMLLFLAGFFPVDIPGQTDPIAVNPVNVTSEHSSIRPDVTNPIVLLFTGVGVSSLFSGLGAVFAVLLAVGGIAALVLTKNYPLAGALFFSAFVVFLFNATKNVIFALVRSPIFSDNWVVEGIYTLITICIGILVVFSIIDMFAPGGTTT